MVASSGMGQHTIGVNERAFLDLKDFQKRLADQGKVFSMTRTIMFLVAFARRIHDEAHRVNKIADVTARANAWRDLVAQAMAIMPDPVTNQTQRPCFKASPEKRAMVIKQIQMRLLIENPPDELVNYYLDQGGFPLMVGSKIQDAEDLKMGASPAQTEGP